MTILSKVTQALYDVIDPELGINIMDLGLIYDIDVDNNDQVKIIMTLTTPGCPLHDRILSGVKYRVGQVDGVSEVDVNLVWEPVWTPLQLSDNAKEQLGLV